MKVATVYIACALALTAAAARPGVGSSLSPPVARPGGGALAVVTLTADLGALRGLGGLYVINADGSGLRRLAPGEVDVGGWSPDGTRIAYGDRNLFVRNLRTGRTQRIARIGARLAGFSWSPDGRRAVYADADHSGENGPLRVVRATGLGRDDVTLLSRGLLPAWSPTGGLVAFLRDEGGWGGNLWVVRPDGARQRRLLMRVCKYLPAWSPDGSELAVIAQIEGRKRLVVVRADGAGTRAIADVPSESCGVAWSPDGTRLAFSGSGTYVVSLNGSGRRRLTPRSGTISWSPDGTRLALDDGDVWVIRTDGHGEELVAGDFGGGTTGSGPKWHPRGAAARQLGGRPISSIVPRSTSVAAGQVLSTRWPIMHLASDGPRVALVYAATRACVETWAPLSGRIVQIPETGCISIPSSEATIVYDLTMGGSRLLWPWNMQTNHDYTAVNTATRDQPIAHAVMSVEDIGDVVGFHGDRDLLVFALVDYGAARGTVYRVERGRAVQIASDRVPLAVDQGRIALAAPAGKVELVDARARVLRVIDARLRGSDPRVALEGSQLVIQRSRSLAVFETETGQLLRTLPVAGGKLVDVHGSVAVYLDGRVVHLVDLRTGRDVSIRPPGTGIVHAQIEGPGLVYSYTRRLRGFAGHVTFVPTAKVRRLFG